MKRAIATLWIFFANLPGSTASAGDAPRVAIRFQVKSADGGFVQDLRSDEVVVTENGKDQTIEDFEGGSYVRRTPLNVVAVFDKAGAFQRQRPIDNQTILEFRDENPAARLSIYACGERITRMNPPSRDLNVLFAAFEALRDMAPARFFNYPELTKALAENVSTETPVVLVIFSAGIGSEEVASDIVRLAKATGSAIYPALLPYSEARVPPRERSSSPNFFHEEAGTGRFSKLADATGGQVLRADPT